MRSCGLVGGDVSLGVSFKISKAHTLPFSPAPPPPFFVSTYLIPVYQIELSDSAPSPCLPAAMLPTPTPSLAMDSYSATVSKAPS